MASARDLIKSISKKPSKGNGIPGKKAASLGMQQRVIEQGPAPSKKTRHYSKGNQVPKVPQPQGFSQPLQEQQVYPAGHHEWAVNRQPMAFYSQALPQYSSIQAAPTVPVYNTFQPLSSQEASGL